MDPDRHGDLPERKRHEIASRMSRRGYDHTIAFVLTQKGLVELERRLNELELQEERFPKLSQNNRIASLVSPLGRKKTKALSLQYDDLPKDPARVRKMKITASINKNSFTGTRNYALFATLLDTGLRASEATGITLTNLNLADGYIKVMGKGSKERIVPIGKYIQMTLWSYIDKVRPEPISPDYNNLFLTQAGKPITVNTVKLVFTRLARSSGVERLHAHLC